MAESQERVYRVLFHNQGKIFDVFVRSVGRAELFGFLELEDFVFSNPTSVVIDPTEDKLRNEFDSVKRVFIPIANVERIDEVNEVGEAKITESDGTQIHQFPTPERPKR
ncbi:MAG: DUF1820 family protein [Gammaproteobacteria bacterium]|nr:DUF1820 family protein [Gammaproteobacteria bacterium]